MNEHKASEIYENAMIAETYASGQNATIRAYQKVLYTLTGQAVPDNFSANHKCASGFFNKFITQETSFEVGNGVTFGKAETKSKLGKSFDSVLYRGVKSALIQGVSFGFFNADCVKMFKLTEFVPLYDEESGGLKAGIRFWQVDSDKPIRYTLFELDGYTEYIKRNGEEITILQEKRNYKLKIEKSVVDGVQIYSDGNYPSFPIVPLWGNLNKQSELVGRREQIDCYDLIKSGFANDLDDASMIYWTLKNAGGMKETDLAKFVERMKTLKAVDLPEDVEADAHTMDVPYQSRDSYLAILRTDLYKDFMALDTDQISAGNVTATQIKAAYEALSEKCDELEMCLFEFFDGIFAVAGIEDTPEFKRSRIVNITEEVETVIQAEPYIGHDEATRQICALLGIADKANEIIQQTTEEEMSRFIPETEKE